MTNRTAPGGIKAFFCGQGTVEAPGSPLTAPRCEREGCGKIFPVFRKFSVRRVRIGKEEVGLAARRQSGALFF